jgi:uncharacterized membrane protein
MQRRAKYFRSVIFIFFVFFSLWFLLQFLAPLALPKGSVSDLSGLVAISDNEDTINDMGLPWGFVYSAGDRLCHQKAERSFFINDNQMPFCSRCTAIWLGIVIGLGFMVFYKIQLNGKFLFAIILSVIPIGVDGIGQLFGFWESTNVVRVITGLLVGSACGVAMGVIVDEIKTIHLFKKIKK